VKTILSVACVLGSFLFTQAYTTADGKEVPPYPIPTTNVVRCSSFVSLYLALRSQASNRTYLITKDTLYNFNTATISIDSPGIKIIGASGDPTNCIIKGNGFENNNSVDFDLIRLQGGAHHVVFANITIAESRCHGVKYNGAGNAGTVFHNVRFINCGERDIKGPVTVDAPNCTLRYCHLENTKIPEATRCVGTPCDGQDDMGNYIAGIDIMSADSWVIHDSYFKNILGVSGGGRAGIFMWNGCRNVWAMRNTFINCDRSIAFGNYSSSSVSHDTSYILNNFIVPGVGNAVELYWTRKVRVFNNTLYSPYNNGSIIYGTTPTGNNADGDIRNNILFSGTISNTNSTPPDTSNNIILTRSLATVVSRWFPNNATGNLHLSSDTCRPVNRGVSLPQVTDDWDNTARTGTIDIGADEFGNTSAISYLPSETGPIKQGYLSPATPNPFNPSTVVRYGVANSDWGKRFTITVISADGSTVRTLKAGTAFPGSYAVAWDARDNTGKIVSSGAYAVRLSVGEKSMSTRVVFMK